MPRPYPMPDNLTGAADVVDYAFTVTSGIISPLFCLVSVIILFALFRFRGTKTSQSLLVSSTLTLILSLFLWTSGYLLGKWVVVLLVVAILSFLWSVLEE